MGDGSLEPDASEDTPCCLGRYACNIWRWPTDDTERLSFVAVQADTQLAGGREVAFVRFVDNVNDRCRLDVGEGDGLFDGCRFRS